MQQSGIIPQGGEEDINFIFNFIVIKKETLAQVFSCEFRNIFKNTFFTEHFHAMWLLLH